MALSFFQELVEERIRQAQRLGLFDDLPAKGKPLALEDPRAVPEELRMAYHILKNAGLVPPEAELQGEIHSLWDLWKRSEDDEERKAILQEVGRKVIRLDLLKRRSFSVQNVGYYGRKLARGLFCLCRKA